MSPEKGPGCPNPCRHRWPRARYVDIAPQFRLAYPSRDPRNAQPVYEVPALSREHTRLFQLGPRTETPPSSSLSTFVVFLVEAWECLAGAKSTKVSAPRWDYFKHANVRTNEYSYHRRTALIVRSTSNIARNSTLPASEPMIELEVVEVRTRALVVEIVGDGKRSRGAAYVL